jgi:hypothetical protein
VPVPARPDPMNGANLPRKRSSRTTSRWIIRPFLDRRRDWAVVPSWARMALVAHRRCSGRFAVIAPARSAAGRILSVWSRRCRRTCSHRHRCSAGGLERPLHTPSRRARTRRAPSAPRRGSAALRTAREPDNIARKPSQVYASVAATFRLRRFIAANASRRRLTPAATSRFYETTPNFILSTASSARVSLYEPMRPASRRCVFEMPT